ncbi:MAG: hypothetical protein ACI8WB_004003 [Phenylobacterium sp.]|jgi:hypothetical protein
MLETQMEQANVANQAKPQVLANISYETTLSINGILA